MSATQLGVAPAAQVNTRPSDRYHVVAPEAPVGSVLRVTTKERSTRFVEVCCPHGRRLFADIDGNIVDFVSWDFATLAEVRAFKLEKRVAELADGVELHGASGLERALAGLDRLERDTTIRLVADELRVRGKPGKASAVLTLRWEGDE